MNRSTMEDFLKYVPIYSKDQENAIASEFKRIQEICYLDHAAAALYSEKQIQLILSDFSDNIYSNPHSLHTSSKLTEDHIDITRFRILQHFNTNNEEYSVIFTSGATESLKTVAETFDYGHPKEGTFVYLQNNHTSVLGMRNLSKNSKELKTEDAFELLNKVSNNANEISFCNNLFAYPAQCNFSGTKYPLEWIESVKKGALNNITNTKSRNWYVLLDAACFLAHETLDLSVYKPDFVAVSFYKIFGYPTGLGALLVRKTSEDVLKKKYFGGGTVFMALSAQNVTMPRKILSDRFEDGTLPFLGILSLKHGFDTLKRLDLTFHNKISRHAFSLAQYVYKSLLSLHHSNGQPVVILYHDTNFENIKHQGAIVNFNLLRENGEHVGYSEVLHMANLHGIQLRTGCHCNPGGCQRFLKLQSSDVVNHFNAGHTCGDQMDIINGRATGTVRISFGYMSRKKDADLFLNLIEDCFVSKPLIRKLPSNYKKLRENYQKLFYSMLEKSQQMEEGKTEVLEIPLSKAEIKETAFNTMDSEATLEQIMLYPVKSCGAFSVSDNWIVTKKGLKFDREWMVVNAGGVCLTQKQNKKMCLIRPTIHLKKNILTLYFKEESSIEINIDEAKHGKESYLCQSKVCGDRVVGWDCGDEVSNWLSENLDMPGLRLLRQYEAEDEDQQLSFANQAQYLLINSRSVEWLRKQVPQGELFEDLLTSIARFRPNLVVKFNKPFDENKINNVKINNISFQFFGNCTRCQMICIDQTTGNISKQPLLTLSKIFKGKINFGIYLNHVNFDNEGVIKIGSKVLIEETHNS